MKKVVSILMVVCLICLFVSPTLAAGGEVFPTSNTSTSSSFDESSLYQLVDGYMLERENLLTSATAKDLQSFAVVGIISDEISHRALLHERDITLLDSHYSITDFNVDDSNITVHLSETISYSESQTNLKSNTLTHTLRITYDEHQNLKVIADLYNEQISGFQSCSYVDPETQNFDIVDYASTSSSSCIVYMAQTQIGYKEKSSNSNLDSFTANAGTANYTKYGAWYGLNPAEWCAMFVSWCANQVGISTSIISKYHYCPTGMDFFKNQGVFYYSSAYGGSYTPRPGDIFFEGTSSTTSSHTGIVISVSGNSVYVVDGNCMNQVSYHDYSLTDSGLVGFARPNYKTTGHSWVNYGSYYRCSDCGMTATSIPDISSIG